MKYILIVLILVISPASVTFGQRVEPLSIEGELNQLLKRLNLPSSTPIKLAKVRLLPETSPLRVYIITGRNTKARSHFIRWIDRWNQKDGTKHGMVEVVPELSQAEVILARFVDTDKATPEVKITTPPGSLIYQDSFAPLYGYIIVRKDDVLEVVTRYSGFTYAREDKPPDFLLREKLFKMMKARHKRK
jgi:hypothetical protein